MSPADETMKRHVRHYCVCAATCVTTAGLIDHKNITCRACPPVELRLTEGRRNFPHTALL